MTAKLINKKKPTKRQTYQLMQQLAITPKNIQNSKKENTVKRFIKLSKRMKQIQMMRSIQRNLELEEKKKKMNKFKEISWLRWLKRKSLRGRREKFKTNLILLRMRYHLRISTEKKSFQIAQSQSSKVLKTVKRLMSL